MTAAQFDALASLVQMRSGPSREAARLVLVDGLRPAEAARQTDLAPQSVSNALATCRRGLELARVAVGPADT